MRYDLDMHPHYSQHFLTSLILAAINLSQTLSFWTFSDIFEEPGFQSQTWIDTFGIVRSQRCVATPF